MKSPPKVKHDLKNLSIRYRVLHVLIADQEGKPIVHNPGTLFVHQSTQRNAKYSRINCTAAIVGLRARNIKVVCFLRSVRVR